MRDMIINGKLFLYFIGTMVLLLFITECTRERQDSVVQQTSTQELPAQEGWNSTLRISKGGHLQTLVRYGHMAQYENKKTIYFDGGITVDFYNEKGQPSSQLQSDRGIYYENTEDVMALGNVVVTSDTGVTLRTSQLRWDNRLEKILSDTTVMVTTQEQDTLYGIGFESEPDLSRWIIRKPWGVTKQSIEFDEIKKEGEISVKKDTHSSSVIKNDDDVVEISKPLEMEDHAQ